MLAAPKSTALQRPLWRPSARWAALALAAALLLAAPVASHAQPAAHGPVAHARQALHRHGYTDIVLRCSLARGALTCNWKARHGRLRCSGSLSVTSVRRGTAIVSVRPGRCSRARAAVPASGRAASVPHPTAIKPPTAAKSPAGSGPTSPSSTQPVTGSPPSASAPVSHPLFGFNTYTTTQTVAEQRALGVTTSRLFVDWAAVEPSPGQWNWQQPDAEYQTMLAGGLRPLIVAFTAPCWARPSTDCSNPYFTGPPDPDHDTDWTTYIQDLTTRYPQAIAIEIWNEPNLDQYFLPHANPTRFTQLLAEAYTAIKTIHPTMPVISGGLLLAPPCTSPITGGECDQPFLTTMYNDGARNYMNGLGVHIYPSDYQNGTPTQWDPNAMTQWLSQLTPIRTAANATNQPIWITEMGISTTTQPGWPAPATPTQQATYLTDMIQTADATPNVAMVTIHTLQDTAATASDPNPGVAGGFGVFTGTFAAKPAACAVSAMLHGSLRC